MTAAAAILSTSCTGRDTQLYMFSLQAQQGIAAAPLVAAAGTDISHWYMLCYSSILAAYIYLRC